MVGESLRTCACRSGSTSASRRSRRRSQSGDSGFVHSFTTGSAVDGPGMRVVAWLTGCQFRCVFCHNPDTWKLNNGMPVPLARAVEEVRKYRHGLQHDAGRVDGERRRAAAAGPLSHPAVHRRQGNEDPHHRRYERLFRRAAERCGPAGIDLVMLGLKALDPDLHRRITGHGQRAGVGLRAPAGGAAHDRCGCATCWCPA